MSSPSSRRLARLLAASPGALARPRAFGASSLAPAPSGSPPGSSARARAVDVCVVGGGVVGTALACALKASPRTAHLSVLLADRSPAPPPAFLDAPRRGVDARVSTVTPSSAAFLRSLGAWDRVVNTRRARAFDAMQVWDASFPGHVRYDAAELGELELGWVVENRVVQAALAERGRGERLASGAEAVLEPAFFAGESAVRRVVFFVSEATRMERVVDLPREGLVAEADQPIGLLRGRAPDDVGGRRVGFADGEERHGPRREEPLERDGGEGAGARDGAHRRLLAVPPPGRAKPRQLAHARARAVRADDQRRADRRDESGGG